MDVIDILIKLVKEKYYIGMENNDSIIETIKNYFSDAVDIQLVPDSNGLNHLLIGLNCELHDLDNAILLSGHMDTIKPNDTWDTDPHIEDGKLYGLGVTDMKAFFAAMIANKEEISKLDLPIVVSITFDEETLGKGIEAITEELQKRNINCSYALIGEPTKNNVVTSSRGNSVYVINTIGKTCHSMNPENGINALYPIAHLVSYIEELNKKYSGLVSLNPILTAGGVAPNQVCGQATLKLSIRTSNIVLRDQVLLEIKSKLDELAQEYKVDTEIIPVFELEAFERKESEINDSIISSFNKNEEEYLATTEAGKIQNIGVENITIMGPGDLNLAHKEGEFCSIELLLEYSQNLLGILTIAIEKIKNKGYGTK